MTQRLRILAFPSISLLYLLACGGGSSKSTPPPTPIATVIAYTDPAGVPATSFCLKKNSISGTHLVLDLYGPVTPVTGSGVVLTLNLDTTKATWGNVSGTALVTNGNVFASNAIVKGKLSGGCLQVVVTERGVGSTKTLNGPLLQIALDLETGQAIGSVITLTPDLTKSQILSHGTTNTIGPLPDLKIGTLTTQ